MKKIFLSVMSLTVLLAVSSCDREPRVKERPDDIIESTLRSEILQKIMEKFPENKSIKQSQGQLFEASAEKQIVLSKESEVYVTYVAEGASYSNSFGWYSYPAGTAPSNPSDVQVKLLFPTVSDRILKQGDMLQLGTGKFPAGTVIGFFLIIKGWENGTVHYDRETFYANHILNTDDQQQHVLFKQQDFGDIILAFEDILTSQESDEDFNDIIFTVTDNKENKEVTNFDLSHVIKL